MLVRPKQKRYGILLKNVFIYEIEFSKKSPADKKVKKKIGRTAVPPRRWNRGGAGSCCWY